jgi:hypothetical protein
LATSADTGLLGIDLLVEDGQWVFAGATPLPDLTGGGPTLLDAIARQLGAGGG